MNHSYSHISYSIYGLLSIYYKNTFLDFQIRFEEQLQNIWR